ncbi:MAG TPA: hypothetical protein VN943_17600 [Candidatus Acidoferrum sp.]|nr:hypothetical protein [Candidatus Acidoferrum sp.]
MRKEDVKYSILAAGLGGAFEIGHTVWLAIRFREILTLAIGLNRAVAIFVCNLRAPILVK